MNLTALSLFSGIGGMCEGVKKAGFEILGAVEQDSYATRNYRLNFPEIPLFAGDVAQFLNEEQPETHEQHVETYFAKGQRKLDLLFGGPPCQGYSQIGPRDIGDPRNELYLEIIRLARQLQPRYIIIENVPNMLLMKGGLFRQRITDSLKSIGYDNIGLTVLNAADYGVPQTRKRVFFVAAKSDVVKTSLQNALDSTAQSLKRSWVSVDEAIGDLPKEVAPSPALTLEYPVLDGLSDYQREMRLDADGMFYGQVEKLNHYHRIDNEIGLHNHHTKEIQERRLHLIGLLAPGAKADSLPKEVWDNARPEKWRRFNGKIPAHTLLAQMHRDLSEWIHPQHDRWITVREALRLQSFHDGFVLGTSEWQMLKQVGNAVPPLLGNIPAMAVLLAESLEKEAELPFEMKGQLTLF